MLRRLAVDQRGVVAVIMAFTLPVLIGFVGLGFDVGFWYFSRQNMQGAADAAAASAAAALSAGNNTGYVTEARAIAAERGLVDGQDGVTVAVTFPYADATTACPTGNNYCLQVVIQKNNEPAMLSSVLGQGNFTIAARSVAVVSHQTYCMLATNSANSNATNVIGIDLSLLLVGILDMRNCSIGSNWQGADSLRLVGLGVVGLNAYTATLMGQFDNQCTLCVPGPQWTHPIKTNATPPLAPILDPYLSRTLPTPGTATTISPVTSVPSCSPGTTITPTTPGQGPGCYLGISVSGSGSTVTLTAGNYTILSRATDQPAISVGSGATLTMGAGNYQILGITKQGSSYDQATNQPAISQTGGTITIGDGTNTIQGGAGSPAISMSGGTLTMGSTNNTILGQGSGQPAINIGGGTLTMGSGSNAIQGGAAGATAITLSGTGNMVTLDGGTYVIGSPSPTNFGISVNTSNPLCGLGFSCGHDLVLGAGTYTIMGGISVTDGNLTLNPNGTSTGTYIMYGGGGTCGGGANVGLCMTAGDLNGQNSTIVLTGSGSNYATFATVQGLTFDGINLTAPQTGPTAGLAVFQDRGAPTTGSNTVYGASFLTVTGALYFPAQSLNFVGVPLDLNNTCLQLIANTISITGLAFVDDACPAGVSPIAGIGVAQLVE